MSMRVRGATLSRVAFAAVVAAATAFAISGVSSASIPDSTGQIHGCYKAGGAASALSVINTALHASCPSGDTALRWDASPPGIGVATGTATAGTTPGAQCTIGEIGLFAQHGAYLPTSYLAANGQALKIASWSPLFALIGTTYGGNGTTTFDLPSLERLAPDHMTYAICVSGVFP